MIKTNKPRLWSALSASTPTPRISPTVLLSTIHMFMSFLDALINFFYVILAIRTTNSCFLVQSYMGTLLPITCLCTLEGMNSWLHLLSLNINRTGHDDESVGVHSAKLAFAKKQLKQMHSHKSQTFVPICLYTKETVELHPDNSSASWRSYGSAMMAHWQSVGSFGLLVYLQMVAVSIIRGTNGVWATRPATEKSTFFWWTPLSLPSLSTYQPIHIEQYEVGILEDLGAVVENLSLN